MKNSLQAKLQNGGKVFGAFIQYMTSPSFVEILPESGIDFFIVSVEHNALDLADFLPMQWALKSRGIACLARVHNRDPEDVARVCDTFPDGVVIPYAEDVEELKRLIAAAKYRPLKGAALEHLLLSDEWPSDKTREYIAERCAPTFFAAMIESRKALDNLEQICALPGLDAVFIGPNDLTVSLGIPEERDHPEFIAAVQRVVDVAEANGIAAGAHFSRLEHTQRLIEQGGRFIPYSSDARVLQFGFAQNIRDLRGELQEGSEKII